MILSIAVKIDELVTRFSSTSPKYFVLFQIKVTWRLSWVRWSYFCDQDTIDNRDSIGEGYIEAFNNDFHETSFINGWTYCDAFSATDAWSTGSRSETVNVPAQMFTLA